jgi:hypothetical protein
MPPFGPGIQPHIESCQSHPIAALRTQLAEERGRHQEMEREMLARGGVVFADLRTQLAEAQAARDDALNAERVVVKQMADKLATIEQIAQGLADAVDPGHRTYPEPECPACQALAAYDAYQQQKRDGVV